MVTYVSITKMASNTILRPGYS